MPLKTLSRVRGGESVAVNDVTASHRDSAKITKATAQFRRSLNLETWVGNHKLGDSKTVCRITQLQSSHCQGPTALGYASIAQRHMECVNLDDGSDAIPPAGGHDL